MIAAILPVLASALAVPDVDRAFFRALSREAGSGNLVVELFAAPDGSIESCLVVFSTDTEARKQRLCEQVREMRVPSIAKDSDGNPAYGFLTLARVVRFNSASNDRMHVQAAYLEVSVQDLPGRDTREVIYLTVFVDAEGTMTDCQESEADDRSLAQIACQQLAGEKQPVVLNHAGTAVPYVRKLRVDFLEQPNG
jgi:hypothetical protein